jgi:hypothetical protein
MHLVTAMIPQIGMPDKALGPWLWIVDGGWWMADGGWWMVVGWWLVWLPTWP